MSGVGPLVATSPTGFDPSANMQLNQVDIRQFSQNPMLWTPRSSMDGMPNEGIPPPPPYQLPPMRVSNQDSFDFAQRLVTRGTRGDQAIPFSKAPG